MQNFLPSRNHTVNDTGKITQYFKVTKGYWTDFIIISKHKSYLVYSAFINIVWAKI